jgi:hypothetical protein
MRFNGCLRKRTSQVGLQAYPERRDRMNESFNLRDAWLKFLIKEVPQQLKTQDASGRFGVRGDCGKKMDEGQRLWKQSTLYPLAALYETPHPENPFFDDERAAEAVFQAGDALRIEQDAAAGLSQFPTDIQFNLNAGTVMDARIGTGEIIVPWTLYHWLQAWLLLSDDLSETRSEAWRRSLETGCTTLTEFLPDRAILPIAAWESVLLTRAGSAFERDLFREVGEEYMRKLAETQDRNGSWRDWTDAGFFSGLHALSLYYEFTRDVWVLPALERARERGRDLLKTHPNIRLQAADDNLFFSAFAPFVAAPLNENKNMDEFPAALLRQAEQNGDIMDLASTADCLLFCRVEKAERSSGDKKSNE